MSASSLPSSSQTEQHSHSQCCQIAHGLSGSTDHQDSSHQVDKGNDDILQPFMVTSELFGQHQHQPFDQFPPIIPSASFSSATAALASLSLTHQMPSSSQYMYSPSYSSTLPSFETPHTHHMRNQPNVCEESLYGYNQPASHCNSHSRSPSQKCYDYALKFLFVGDSDVGKNEILNSLPEISSCPDSPCFGSQNVTYRTTIILLDGKRVKLHLWDTSGQGRFSTVIRCYSRGAQGILLVYDITNKWSFSGLDRWLKEIEEHAPGVPMVLIGNRLHLEFNRQVSELSAEMYAKKHGMAFFEVSALVDYNIRESFAQLSRMALQRNGMEHLWRHSTVLSLQELCCRALVQRVTVYGIERLPLPTSLKLCLKSYTSDGLNFRPLKFHSHHYPNRVASQKHSKSIKERISKALFQCDMHSKTSTLPRPSSTKPTANRSQSVSVVPSQNPSSSSAQSKREKRSSTFTHNKSCTIS